MPSLDEIIDEALGSGSVSLSHSLVHASLKCHIPMHERKSTETPKRRQQAGQVHRGYRYGAGG